jgi:hypothetical protein
MKKKIFFIFLLVVLTVICLGLLAFRHIFKEKAIDETSAVHIKKTEKGYQLIRNGKPFHIKGASGDSYFKELADFGGNTIHLYDTINLQSNLDEALKYGLAVVVNIPIPAFSYSYTLKEDESRALKYKVKKLVKKYKNHEALLMWNLGNEIYPQLFKWRDYFNINFLKVSLEKIRYINTLNELIEIIQNEDKNHPVSTTTWLIAIPKIISIKVFSPGIDLLAYNIFGNTERIVEEFNEFHFLFGVFPYFISEFGSDGCWGSESKITSWGSPIEQTSIKKADQIKIRYNLIQSINENCLGSLLFFWGNKFEGTDTWFSLFENEYKSEILLEVKKLWGNFDSQPKFIGLDYMLVDGKGAYDNIIFVPNELKISELKFSKNWNDSLKIRWEILPDTWYYAYWYKDTYKKLLDSPLPMNCFLNIDKNSATFVTPGIEGPYRIFATVYNQEGYFATANTPFYVLNNK